jgi:4-hydroxybenzoate polyprenyltransferase
MNLGMGFWIAWVVAVGGWTWQFFQLRLPQPMVYGQIFRQNVWLGFVLLIGMELGLLRSGLL